MSNSVRPHRRQPIRLPGPWDSPGKNTGVGCHFLLQCMRVKSESEVAQSCPTLSDPMDCSLPGSSVRGIFQARVLEWGAIAFSVFCKSMCLFLGFPGGSDGKKSACNERGSGLIPGSGRSPGRREWLLTPAFFPEEFHGQRSLAGFSPYATDHRVTKSWTRPKRLSTHACTGLSTCKVLF